MVKDDSVKKSVKSLVDNVVYERKLIIKSDFSKCRLSIGNLSKSILDSTMTMKQKIDFIARLQKWSSMIEEMESDVESMIDDSIKHVVDISGEKEI